ncbi:Piso0_005058 [Millerozyma farinosa CBS 7064]|uniref:Piso0_005058 protein n=1 Tax=Pichia sorbitophila (strain ATCC MYA-4447 / BCRC 22081 / CBS 7064 / NBRC 10061 / NRRL Y-12695) TaxID=559304 RepID=G8Y444_PICSO|nr:Piso0_005058 [Millerozyma farinosa CBS 7064]
MDDTINTFLAVTGVEDEEIAKQYLNVTNNDLEYAVTLYMESNPPQSAITNHEPEVDDQELVQRLQNEEYGEPEVREADANIHRHETLIDTFDDPFQGPVNLNRPTDIFGSGRVGIFNQRFYDEEQNSSEDPYEEVHDEESDDQDEVLVLDSDGEVIETERQRPQSRRRLNRTNRMEQLTSTQRRLANLFRPPFDIMSKVNIDTAKQQGRRDKKWILINIQNFSEFSCQVLNRDLWSNSSVKILVNENFIFLQYQHDSPNGASYSNFYSIDDYPHIAILDPLTGERVKKWKDGIVPTPEDWIEETNEFLNNFSLNPGSSNPVVTHERKLDPDAMSEEQQIEFAMKQSIIDNRDKDGSNEDKSFNNEHIQVDEPDVEIDQFDSVESREHTEPTVPSDSTRIQVRFPSGKRIIHRFLLNEKVVTIFQWLKFILSQSDGSEYGIGPNDRFILSNISSKSNKSLLESLDSTVQETNLKNASLLIEKE